MKRLVVALAVVFSGAAFAAGTDPFAKVAEDTDFIAGKKAVDASDWKAAISSFTRVTNRHRDEPDGYNMLGYSYRKSGDVDNAFRYYNAALRLDGSHKGAHQYIGEAFLMKNDVASAEKHLAALDRICGKDCEEYQDLAKAITAHKNKR